MASVPNGISAGPGHSQELVLADADSEIVRWKPWPFHPGFILITIVGLHLVQIFLIIWVLLMQIAIPPSALFTFGGDQAAAYFAWRLIPVMSAVLLGLLWSIVDLNVRRLEPFYQMSLPRGATIKESLSLDYGSTMSLLVPFISLWRRHYFVTLSSAIYLLAFLVLPISHDRMWEIGYDTSSELFTVIVSEGWVYATLGITALIVVLAGILSWAAWRRKYGLVADPAGLAGLASLVYGSNVLDDFKDIPAYQTQAFIDAKLQNRRFWLRCTSVTRVDTPIWVNQIVSGVDEGEGHTTVINPPFPQQCTTPFKQSRWEAHPWSLSGRFLFLPSLLLLGPYIAMTIGIQQTVHSTSNSWSPGVMRSLIMLATTINTAYWTLIDADLRLVEPWRQLSLVRSTDKAARTEAIIVDWERMNPVSSFCIGLSKGATTLVAWVSFGSLLSQITTVIYPALSDSLWKVVYSKFNTSSESLYYGLPQSLDSSARILLFVSYPIVFMNSVIWLALFSRRRPVVPRKPSMMSSKIVYICCSTRLLQDVRDASSKTVKERAARLRASKKGYAFGWFRVGERMRLGVEREPLEKEYSYGQLDG